MENFEGLLALILFSVFIGVFFIGGFYMGYRYRDNFSLERQRKYRPSQLLGTSRVSASSAAGSEETSESPIT
jgi:hypothetical protein